MKSTSKIKTPKKFKFAAIAVHNAIGHITKL